MTAPPSPPIPGESASPADTIATSAPLRGDPHSVVRRLHGYTTFSLASVVFAFMIVAVLRSDNPFVLVGGLLAGAIVMWQTFRWDPNPPTWLSVAAITTAGAYWVVMVWLWELPWSALLLAVAIVLGTRHLRHRWIWTLALTVPAALVPVIVNSVGTPAPGLVMPWTITLVVSVALSVLMYRFNDYLWSLTVKLDDARRQAASLATVAERYRFARDLHDIQGHTLTAIKVKTALARKLVDRDPAAAAEHLRDVEQLAAEAIASTRSLAYGDRRVTLAAELANAQQLITSAGIGWQLDGIEHLEDLDASDRATAYRGADPASTATRDELLALVVREATTNLLQHAQPTTVSVTLSATGVVVRNDGAIATTGGLRGLDHLARRCAARGGQLRTSVTDGVFTTEATL